VNLRAIKVLLPVDHRTLQDVKCPEDAQVLPKLPLLSAMLAYGRRLDNHIRERCPSEAPLRVGILTENSLGFMTMTPVKICSDKLLMRTITCLVLRVRDVSCNTVTCRSRLASEIRQIRAKVIEPALHLQNHEPPLTRQHCPRAPAVAFQDRLKCGTLNHELSCTAVQQTGWLEGSSLLRGETD
jgi:hypothetical protein